jgi:hypothetical protein
MKKIPVSMHFFFFLGLIKNKKEMGCGSSVTWTSDFRVGDHLIMEYSQTQLPRVRVLTQVHTKTIHCRYLTTVIYDDVVKNCCCPRDSTKVWKVKSSNKSKHQLRRATERERLSGSVPRVKGTECEVFVDDEKYNYPWTPATIVSVSKKNKTMHLKNRYGKLLVLPLTSLDVAPMYTHTKHSSLPSSFRPAVEPYRINSCPFEPAEPPPPYSTATASTIS